MAFNSKVFNDKNQIVNCLVWYQTGCFRKKSKANTYAKKLIKVPEIIGGIKLSKIENKNHPIKPDNMEAIAAGSFFDFKNKPKHSGTNKETMLIAEASATNSYILSDNNAIIKEMMPIIITHHRVTFKKY